jgi:hypothetical protein
MRHPPKKYPEKRIFYIFVIIGGIVFLANYLIFTRISNDILLWVLYSAIITFFIVDKLKNKPVLR